MSLARATLVRPKPITSAVLQRRCASHDSHSHEEHYSHYDPEVGFFTPFWRNTLLASVAAVAFYKWAPAPNEDVYLTRWLAHYSTPRDFWARLNRKHLVQAQQETDTATVQTNSKPPGIRRYRYPQSLGPGSPHLQPVGSAADVSYVGLKAD
ncbi:hypothetical protein F5I97DRAFT_2055693 [Phlebopus sp. FC_14]|nr:hypothetical protein F5I97DRAFT_2055693 [Phlebopus sp. FC_14]